MIYDDQSRAIDDEDPSIDDQSRAIDVEDPSIDDLCRANVDRFRAFGDEYRTIADEDRAIDGDVRAFDDQFEAFDDEDRAFDFEYRTIDDEFGLISGQFPSKDCVAQTNDGVFALKLGSEGSIACVEGPYDTRDRSNEAKFPTIPDVYLCFAVVDGRRVDAFLA
jgi:hypothetical protein